MTTQTDELLAFYAAEFERETGCKWTAISIICEGLTSSPHEPNGEKALTCPHRTRVSQCVWVKALNGGLQRWMKGTVQVEDYSAEPIGIAEWHRRVLEMKR